MSTKRNIQYTCFPQRNKMASGARLLITWKHASTPDFWVIIETYQTRNSGNILGIFCYFSYIVNCGMQCRKLTSLKLDKKFFKFFWVLISFLGLILRNWLIDWFSCVSHCIDNIPVICKGIEKLNWKKSLFTRNFIMTYCYWIQRNQFM